MTEDEARDWVVARFGSDAAGRIDAFLAMVVAEAEHQNLVAPSTIPTIWARHAVDSLQLVALAEGHRDRWIDIGTGGGFPGLAIALAIPVRMTLVEPRRRRAAFLSLCVARLGIADRVDVRASKIESVTEKADVISARAVATIGNLLRAAAHCGNERTRWLLPRGKIDESELSALHGEWKLMFHVEQSITSEGSSIVVLDRVSAR